MEAPSFCVYFVFVFADALCAYARRQSPVVVMPLRGTLRRGGSAVRLGPLILDGPLLPAAHEATCIFCGVTDVPSRATRLYSLVYSAAALLCIGSGSILVRQDLGASAGRSDGGAAHNRAVRDAPMPSAVSRRCDVRLGRVQCGRAIRRSVPFSLADDGLQHLGVIDARAAVCVARVA
jgi:hypothetical protein